MSLKIQIVSTLIIDIIILSLAFLNVTSLSERAEVPKNIFSNFNNTTYNVNPSDTISKVIEFQGIQIKSGAFLNYYLTNNKKGDLVRIKLINNNEVFDLKIKLVAKYSNFSLFTIIFVSLVYFFTALFVFLKFNSAKYSKILHWLAISTMIMIIFDWGSVQLYGKLINGLIWILYDSAIFLIPTLFLHFSFLFPIEKPERKLLILIIFYTISIIGIIISFLYIIAIFCLSIDINRTYYVELHSMILDIFLITGLIFTVGNFEHSVIHMKNALDKKKIYWILLGIFLGPLVYVFLMLIPRIMLGYELVNEIIMQYSIMLAPIMFIIAIKKKK